MSKKDLNLQMLNSNPKKEISTSQDEVEKAVEAIHESPLSKERTKRVTIDFPISLYKEIRGKTIQDEITLKEYFIRLAKLDLNS